VCHQFVERGAQWLHVSGLVELALAQDGIQLALLVFAHQYFSHGWVTSLG
jgi:hypothetical protein